MEIMNYENKRWNEFTHKLNKQLKIQMCDSTREKENAEKVLNEMGDIDIEKTFEFFESKGGYCDCEIMFNVVQWD